MGACRCLRGRQGDAGMAPLWVIPSLTTRAKLGTSAQGGDLLFPSPGAGGGAWEIPLLPLGMWARLAGLWLGLERAVLRDSSRHPPPPSSRCSEAFGFSFGCGVEPKVQGGTGQTLRQHPMEGLLSYFPYRSSWSSQRLLEVETDTER